MLARVVLRTNHLSSARPLLSELHWLPVASRIQFKIATLTHKILSTGTPSYLSLCWTTTSPLDSFVRPVLISVYNHPQKLNLALLHFTPLHNWSGMACQPMSVHHLPFRLSRKCSKLIISTALPRSHLGHVPVLRLRFVSAGPTRTLTLWPWHVFQIVIIIIITIHFQNLYQKITADLGGTWPGTGQMNETLLNKFEIFEDSARIGKHPRLCPIAMSNLKFQTLYQLCNSVSIYF